jgi:hypothetical protein
MSLSTQLMLLAVMVLAFSDGTDAWRRRRRRCSRRKLITNGCVANGTETDHQNAFDGMGGNTNHPCGNLAWHGRGVPLSVVAHLHSTPHDIRRVVVCTPTRLTHCLRHRISPVVPAVFSGMPVEESLFHRWGGLYQPLQKWQSPSSKGKTKAKNGFLREL